MRKKIDINVDLGEGFGYWAMGKPGQDEEIMKYVTSVNIACGFHAGDSHIMRKTVKLAKKNGVEVGAHPGLPDLIGFGRRRMDVRPEELTDYVVYQVGALKAIAASEGVEELQHVLIHGIACVMCWYEEKYAKAYTEALVQLDPAKKLIMYGGAGGPGPKYVLDNIAKNAGLRVVDYWILDMDYNPDGSIVMLREHPPVDVKDRIQRVVNMFEKGVIKDINGGDIPYQPQSLLVHSDTPNVVELLKTLREQLPSYGIEVVPMKEIV
jgi:UPF0271 protein